MTEDSVILLERKFIKASVVTYFTAYIAGSLMSALAWPGVTSLNAAEFWMFWPVNLRYIIQISANFGSTDGWNGFLFSNYIISSLMIIRMAYLFSVELSKPRDSFTWGINYCPPDGYTVRTDSFVPPLPRRATVIRIDVLRWSIRQLPKKQFSRCNFLFRHHRPDREVSKLAEILLAVEKHVLNGEFAALGVKTRKQFQEFVEKIVSNLTVDRRYAKDGTVFYLDHQTVVVRGQRGEARAYRLDFDLGWEFYIENRVPKTKTSPGYDPVGNGRTY